MEPEVAETQETTPEEPTTPELQDRGKGLLDAAVQPESSEPTEELDPEGMSTLSVQVPADFEVPKNFQDKDGNLNAAAMFKSWKDTRAALEAAKKAAGPGAPEGVEGYLSDDFVSDGQITLGDGEEAISIPTDDPLLGVFAESSLKHGLSPEQMQGVVRDIMGSDLMSEASKAAYIDPDAEMAKLGDAGPGLTSAVGAWVDSLRADDVISEAEHNRLYSFASTAENVQLLGRIVEEVTQKPIPRGNPVGTNGYTVADYDQYFEKHRNEIESGSEYHNKELDRIGAAIWGDN